MHLAGSVQFGSGVKARIGGLDCRAVCLVLISQGAHSYRVPLSPRSSAGHGSSLGLDSLGF